MLLGSQEVCKEDTRISLPFLDLGCLAGGPLQPIAVAGHIYVVDFAQMVRSVRAERVGGLGKGWFRHEVSWSI